MSQVTVAEVKAYLPVIHSADDALLQQLIDAAEQEACRYLNRENLATLPLEYPASSSSDAPYTEELPSSDDPIAADVRMAVFLLVKGNYRSEPGERGKYRDAALDLLAPYRNRIGV
jgi:hypothetical protein